MKLIICNNICLQQLCSVIIRGKTNSHVPLCFADGKPLCYNISNTWSNNTTFRVSVYSYKAYCVSKLQHKYKYKMGTL